MEKTIRRIRRIAKSRRKPRPTDLPQKPEVLDTTVVSLMLWELHNQQRS